MIFHCFMNPYDLLAKYYDTRSELYYILIKHSEQVRDKALEVAKKHPELNADLKFIAEAALLHDIGIFQCNAPRIYCLGSREYIEHGYLGAEILVKEDFAQHALVCERHTGTGISLDKIIERNLPLPHRDMRPVSIEEKIICYADKFYSKSELHRTIEINRIRLQLSRHGAENVATFDEWHKLFG